MTIGSLARGCSLFVSASLLVAAGAEAANEEIYICAIIPDTQTARPSLSLPTTLETRIKWLVDMRFAFDQDPQDFYDNFDPADFSDANWNGRTGLYGLPIRCVLHVGDVVESEWDPGDLGFDSYVEHEKAMKLLMDKSYKDVAIPYLVSAGNHDRSPDPYAQPGLAFYTYCYWIDFFGASHYASYPWFKGANPAFVQDFNIHCDAEGFERKEESILHAEANVGPAGKIGLMALGWEILPDTKAKRDELYGYVNGIIKGSGMPWFLVSHHARWGEPGPNGRCLDTGPEFTLGVTKPTLEVALHVGGHWFQDFDNTDPPSSLICECWDANRKNDLQLQFVSGCFNHQGWERVPSSKGPISLLIVDESYNAGQGRLWYRSYDAVNDDWYEDADSSGLLTPIDFQARRLTLIRSETPTLGSLGLALAGIGLALVGALRLAANRRRIVSRGSW